MGIEKAHSLVSDAVAKGTLVPAPCEVCGAKESQAHHEDYNKPLDVKWLCAKHHKQEHIRLKKAGIKIPGWTISKSTAFPLRLPGKLYEGLKEAADKEERTVSNLIRLICGEYLRKKGTK